MTQRIGPVRKQHVEKIDNLGYKGAPRLRVPVFDSFDRPPVREGWEPFFVNVDLNRVPVKIFTYRQKEAA